MTDLTPSELDELISDAESNAYTDREVEFVADMREKLDKYGHSVYVSSKQDSWLRKIAQWE